MQAVKDATGASATGRLDDRGLTDDLFGMKLPWYVLRLLSGANAVPRHDGVLVASCGREFLVSAGQFDRVHRYAKRVQAEVCVPLGLSQPYNLEDVLAIQNATRMMCDNDALLDAAKLRVCFLRTDESGPGWYRAMQPTSYLNACTHSINAQHTNWLNIAFGRHYDVVVASRVSDPDFVEKLLQLRSGGTVLVFETDDALEDIPDWNPAKKVYTPQHYAAWAHLARHADALIVSTHELKARMGHTEKTHVVENGIAPELWPCAVRTGSTDGRVRALWSGSQTHAKDLEVMVPAIKALLHSTPELDFVFMNFLPMEFTQVSVSASGATQRSILPALRERITFVPGVPVSEYPKAVAGITADIALAPLVDIPFNRCKSALKVMEAWALGLPVLASDVAPYHRAVQHGVNGILLQEPKQWHDALRALVRAPEQRAALATAGVQTLRARHTMTSVVQEYERVLLTLARGKVRREECAAAVAARCTEKGW